MSGDLQELKLEEEVLGTVHLTDRALRSLSTDKLQADVYDAILPGLGVRVSRRGRKTFFLRYHFEGKHHRLKLGLYPVMTLSEARSKARQVLGELAAGRNPKLEGRPASSEGPTFQELAEEYLERHAKPRKRTWRQDQQMMERDLLPEWGRRRACEVDRTDVVAVLDKIVDRGAPIQANRVLALIRKIYNWGLGRGLVDANPCAALQAPSVEKRRERVLTEAEIRTVWQTLEGNVLPIRSAIRVLLLTAQRNREVVTMRWDNLGDGLWRLPMELTKAKRSHIVPISSTVQRLLDDLRRAPTTEWVFPSPRRSQEGRIGNTTLTAVASRLRKQVGFDWRIHDLRRTAASHMAALRVPRFVIGRILNHADPSVTAVYDRHTYIPEMREALELWGKQVEEIVRG